MLLASLYMSDGRQAEKTPGLTSIKGNKVSITHADPDSSCLTDPKNLRTAIRRMRQKTTQHRELGQYVSVSTLNHLSEGVSASPFTRRHLWTDNADTSNKTVLKSGIFKNRSVLL